MSHKVLKANMNVWLNNQVLVCFDESVEKQDGGLAKAA